MPRPNVVLLDKKVQHSLQKQAQKEEGKVLEHEAIMAWDLLRQTPSSVGVDGDTLADPNETVRDHDRSGRDYAHGPTWDSNEVIHCCQVSNLLAGSEPARCLFAMKEPPVSAPTACPECGSTDLEDQGFLAQWQRLYCDACGRVFYVEDYEE